MGNIIVNSNIHLIQQETLINKAEARQNTAEENQKGFLKIQIMVKKYWVLMNPVNEEECEKVKIF